MASLHLAQSRHPTTLAVRRVNLVRPGSPIGFIVRRAPSFPAFSLIVALVTAALLARGSSLGSCRFRFGGVYSGRIPNPMDGVSMTTP